MRRIECFVLAIAFAASSASAGTSGAEERVLRTELTLAAPVADVWNAWTTERGIATFLAPEGHVDLRVDGTYDVWFNPKGAPGERGAEGMRILGVEPMKRFAFTWNAPPSIPSIRGQRTMVILDFAPDGPRATRFTFREIGWGEGDDWDRAYEYFTHAWSEVVLPRLVHRFEHGAIDWAAPPRLQPVAWQATALPPISPEAPSTHRMPVVRSKKE